MIGTDLIRARNLEFRTSGGEYLVRNLDLAVTDGERLGIIGPNGAGKSTLLRMLCGTLSPTSGDIYLEATRLDAYKAMERARRLAVVGQSDQPDPRIALIDYVALGRIPHVGLRAKADDREIVGQALERTGLSSKRFRTLGSLSGGERQRAQIARAIAQQPTVLFLDEPTNHLDPRARGEVLELVAGLGITVVAVLHDLALVAPFATRIAVLSEGRLVAYDTPSRTLLPPLVREVFSVDVLRLPHPAEDRELTVFDIPIRLSATT